MPLSVRLSARQTDSQAFTDLFAAFIIQPITRNGERQKNALFPVDGGLG